MKPKYIIYLCVQIVFCGIDFRVQKYRISVTNRGGVIKQKKRYTHHLEKNAKKNFGVMVKAHYDRLFRKSAGTRLRFVTVRAKYGIEEFLLSFILQGVERKADRVEI